MKWTLTAPIPSFEKNYRFHPVTNQHWEAIIKYCMSKDDTGLIMYMQHMLQELCLDDSVKFTTLPGLDQLLLLIRLRSICIGPRVEITIEGEEKTAHKMSLIALQKSINEHYLQAKTLDFPESDLYITMHYPTGFVEPDPVSYVSGYVIGDQQIDCNELNNEQKNQLFEQLSTDQLKQIQKTCKLFDESVDKMVLVNLPEEDNITLSYDQFSYIVRLMYSDSYPNFVELMYIFVKIIRMSLSDVMKLTPSDTQMYYQMFVKETKEREKAQKQANNSNATSRDVPSRGL